MRDATIPDVLGEDTVGDRIGKRLRLPLLGASLGADAGDELKEPRAHTAVGSREADVVEVPSVLEAQLVLGLVLAKQLDSGVDHGGVREKICDLSFGVARCHMLPPTGGWGIRLLYQGWDELYTRVRCLAAESFEFKCDLVTNGLTTWGLAADVLAEATAENDLLSERESREDTAESLGDERVQGVRGARGLDFVCHCTPVLVLDVQGVGVGVGLDMLVSCPLDLAANPVMRVGDELDPAVRVESVGGDSHPEEAFGDEVVIVGPAPGIAASEFVDEGGEIWMGHVDSWLASGKVVKLLPTVILYHIAEGLVHENGSVTQLLHRAACRGPRPGALRWGARPAHRRARG